MRIERFQTRMIRFKDTGRTKYLCDNTDIEVFNNIGIYESDVSSVSIAATAVPVNVISILVSKFAEYEVGVFMGDTKETYSLSCDVGVLINILGLTGNFTVILTRTNGTYKNVKYKQLFYVYPSDVDVSKLLKEAVSKYNVDIVPC